MTFILRHLAAIFIIAIITFSYTWIYFFQDQTFIREVGVFILHFIGTFMGLVWVLKTYFLLKKEKDQQSNFWLILGIGIVPLIVGWMIWAYYYLLLRMNPPYPGPADYLWFLAYIVWGIALFYELIRVLKKSEIIRSLFDISIFMIVSIALIWEMVASNIFLNLNGNLLTDIVSFVYPIIDLILLFVTVLLYFTTRNDNRRTIFTLISLGFTSQVIADFIYVHLSSEGSYVFGGLIDPLWTLTLLLKGSAGLYAIHLLKCSSDKKKVSVGRIHPDVTAYILFSIFLIYIIFHHYKYFTFLEYAFVLLILIVIIRHVIVLFQKEKAINELNSLSKNLEAQVKIKTQELHGALNQVKKMALYDHLTGLPNRYFLNETLDMMIERCKQMKTGFSIMFLDLDRFKFVNDSMGHDTGDLLLKEVSKRLERSVREGDMIARLGGDEFIILLKNIEQDGATLVAERIIKEFEGQFNLKGNEFLTTTSIGISVYPRDGENKTELIASADQAMYMAKKRGKNNYQFYGLMEELKI